MLLRPSNSSRWSKCPGSFDLEGRYPEDDDSLAAREGTAAHWWALDCALRASNFPIVGSLAPNGESISQEMVDGGMELIGHVGAVLASCSPSTVIKIEQPLTMHGLIHPLCEGTPDIYIVDHERHKLWIIDYKFGHRYVDATTPQLTCYVAGVFEAYELDLTDIKGWEICRVICQPRCYSAEYTTRTHVTLGWHVWDEIKALSVAAEAASDPQAPVKTNDACKYCSANHVCPAAQRQGADILELSLERTPVDMTPASLGFELTILEKAAKRLEARLDSLREQAVATVQKGMHIPGWKMGRAGARERWADPDGAAQMGDLLGVDIRKPGMLTPPQARDKLAAAKIDTGVIASYHERPLGAPKLVPFSDDEITKAFG